MKISRTARNQYQLEDFDYSQKGNIIFDGDIYSVRLLVQKLNKEKDLINYPEIAIRIGQFNGMSLIFEINDYLIKQYKELNNETSINEELYEYLKEKIGQEKLLESTKKLIEEFPPESVFKNEIDIDKFLEKKTNELDNKFIFIEEFANLWLGNLNPAFSSFIEFFNDDLIEKGTAYNEIIESIHTFFENKPKIGSNEQNLIDFLREPALKHPHSIKEQLEYIHEHWGNLLGKYLMRILIALDLIREEEMMRGLGPGEAKILEYDMFEYENYTPDKEWMPKVVMIAKNTYVWMEQLSKKYNRSITKLHEIPNEELDQLSSWGFNALWLIGVWERCQASKTIKRWCGNPEAEASAYSIYDYIIAYDLGGYNSYKNLKDRAWARGIRLASDMVPNHTGIVSKWIMEHPDWFISLPYPPFPSYVYTGISLSGDPNIGIYIEDKYFSRSDAAVTFKRIDFRNNDTRYIYHGNDGTSFPWNDTAQLNFLNPEVREAVIQTILYVSRLFPIIRFDAAMTLTRKHFQRLWYPEPGTGGAIPSRAEHGMSREDFLEALPEEFWREVVNRINEENPDTLLLAEAFWLLEGFFVRTLGMHRVYNSAFMNMLRDEDNTKYRAVLKNTLAFDPKILKRFVNFMNNPDEETAIKQFADGDKYFGICTMMVTMPGLPIFGHGQIEGYHEKYGMEYRKPYWNESINWGLLRHHERTIFPIMKKRYLFADVKNFILYDFWTGNYVNEDVFAYSNRFGDERGLVIYHNKYAETKGYIKSSVGYAIKDGENITIIQKNLAEGLVLPTEGYCIFKDYIMNLEYIRRNTEIHEKGLYLELKAYQRFVFLDFRIVQDDEFFHYAQLHDLLGGKGTYSINETLQKIIYQSLHAPFEQIVNANNFKRLIRPSKRDAALNQIYSKLKKFLEQVKKYSSGENTISIVEDKIKKKLQNILSIENIIKSLEIKQEFKDYLENITPKNDYEWSILLSWLFIHQIGKIVSIKNYELLSRSWIDEWQLSKYIQLTLQEVSKKEIQKPWEATLLIKILTSQQNLFTKEVLMKQKENMILRYLFADPDMQKYLNFNRFKDILWFSAEAFYKFVDWFLLIIIVNRLTKYDEFVNQDIEKIIIIIRNWKNLAKIAEFKVVEFLNLVDSEK